MSASCEISLYMQKKGMLQKRKDEKTSRKPGFFEFVNQLECSGTENKNLKSQSKVLTLPHFSLLFHQCTEVKPARYTVACICRDILLLVIFHDFVPIVPSLEWVRMQCFSRRQKMFPVSCSFRCRGLHQLREQSLEVFDAFCLHHAFWG